MTEAIHCNHILFLIFQSGFP